MLPEHITHGGSAPVPAQAPEEFTVSRVAPDGRHITQADLEAGARTAAELGFDDSRYEAPQVTGDTVRLGRADIDRLREAGRSAPGPQTPPQVPPPVRHEPATGQPGFGSFQPSADDPLGGPGNGAHRVGFSRPEPVATGFESTTSAGLPRRERPRQRPEEDPAQRLREQPPAPQPPAETQWDRGPRREERTGGTTASGLPRRVPRANLTEHPTSEPAAGGPQVSRDPTEVRGRLSSLHRGVQQGRGARTGRGTRNDDQER